MDNFKDWFSIHVTNHLFKLISSCECNKVVSVFWLFCRKCRFVFIFFYFFKFFFINLSFLIFFHKTEIFRLQAWTKSWIVCFHLYFPNQQKTKFLPKMHIRFRCTHMTIYFRYTNNDTKRSKVKNISDIIKPHKMNTFR